MTDEESDVGGCEKSDNMIKIEAKWDKKMVAFNFFTSVRKLS